MSKSCPSDISRKQFEAIQPMLESARRKTSPRRVDLYEVFCAVLYLLRSGCQWRMLPEEFPKWRTVHSYWSIWSEPREGGSLLEQALKKTGWRGPRETGAQRLQQLFDHRRAEREERGHGGLQGLSRKKVSGIKRHIAVDTQGLPHAVTVTTAEVTDRKGAVWGLGRCRSRLGQVKSYCATAAMWGSRSYKACRRSWVHT